MKTPTLMAAMLIVLGGLLVVPGSDAATTDPLVRAAVAQRMPERALLLGAALAGARVVAVGERGLVALSDDHGKTWRQARQVPTSVTLTVVKFADATSGWAAGHGGLVLHTVDGGETWVQQLDGKQAAQLVLQRAEVLQRSNAPGAERQVADARRLVADGADKPLLDLELGSDGRLVVVGAYGLILSSADGGAHWESWMDRAENPKGLHLYAVRSHAGRLQLAGEQGLLLSSMDGGQRFMHDSSPYSGSWFTLAAQGDTMLIAGLRGNAYRRNGKEWQKLEGLPPLSVSASAAAEGGCILIANQAGQLFVVDDDKLQVKPLKRSPLSPVSNITRLGNGEWLALTTQGAFLLGPMKQACSSNQVAVHHG